MEFLFLSFWDDKITSIDEVGDGGAWGTGAAYSTREALLFVDTRATCCCPLMRGGEAGPSENMWWRGEMGVCCGETCAFSTSRAEMVGERCVCCARGEPFLVGVRSAINCPVLCGCARVRSMGDLGEVG